MPAFQSLTPNLVVSDIERSLSFYRDLLGFSVVTTVPRPSHSYSSGSREATCRSS
jgi:catechol 2,3-dioxygenase-like lactoylglutathione lyase family enzyme